MNRQQQLRRFNPVARLRRVGGTDVPHENALVAAVTRISKSPDGKLLLDWLWTQTHGKVLPLDAPDSAFRDLNANRSLFDKILRLVEDTDDGRRTDGK